MIETILAIVGAAFIIIIFTRLCLVPFDKYRALTEKLEALELEVEKLKRGRP